VGPKEVFKEVFGEDGAVVGEEFAEVFLTEGLVGESLTFFFEEGRADAGARGGGNLDAVPFGIGVDPGLVEEAGIAVGSGHDE